VSVDSVTVVIPTKDRWPVLRRALRAVLLQDAPGVDVDVVVVDGASSDGTAARLRGLGDPRVRVLEEEPRGVSRARNAGIEAARGRWVAFLDDDDLWAPSKLRSQLAALARDPGATWSCTGAVRVHDGLRLGGPEPTPVGGDVVPALLRGNAVPAGASSVVARTDVVRELGGFDPALSNAADWDMWLRLATTGRLAAVGEPLVAYYVHAASMAHDVASSRRDLDHFAAKHADLAAQHGTGVDRDAAELYFASCSVRAGDRAQALALYRGLLRRRAVGPLALGVAAVGLTGTAGRGALDLLGRYRLPRRWRREVQAWLAPFRDEQPLSAAASA
jgi:glycosyltransferase involved in cell wall biosynthesis